MIDAPVQLAQATYLPQKDELEVAWYLLLGSALWLLTRAKNKPTKRELLVSVVCAALGYAFAIEALEFSLTGKYWWCEISQFPNVFAGFVGFVSHNLPMIYGWVGSALRKRIER